jgi:hypothetical protein
MRRLPALRTILMASLIGPIGAARSAPPARAGDGPTDDRARAAEFLALATREAESYTFRTEAGAARFALRAEPILRWTNPVVGTIHGGVFLWTDKGRPEVVASIYQWYSPFTHRTDEFQSLATGTFVAERDGRPVWTPARPGVEFRLVPDAPVPAGSPAGRFRQMRALAAEFTGRQTDRQGVDRDMRLLAQPVYRYEATEGDPIDGALFAFVLGTDPEAFLLIEACRAGDASQWQYATARMNSIHLRINRQGREVWSVPELPWSQVGDRREPYTTFRFYPEAATP